jgi:RNA polymerase sigma-70 factor (ECF subfamily)
MIQRGPWPRSGVRSPFGPSDDRAFGERELVLAYFLHDDQPAFVELSRRLAPYLTAVARRRVGDERAADLVQQAFLNAHAARDAFDLECAFRPWLTCILVNLCVDDCRTRQRWQPAEIDPIDLEAPPVRDTLEQDRKARLARRALSCLSPEKRRVIEMHWLEERPFPEVAEKLAEPLSTVKVRAHRAYKDLRRELLAASAPRERARSAPGG